MPPLSRVQIHRLAQQASMTLAKREAVLLEDACRSGAIVGAGFRPHDLRRLNCGGLFKHDRRLHSFCRDDVWEAYKNARTFDVATFLSDYGEDALRRDFVIRANSSLLYRYTDSHPLSTLESVLALCRQRTVYSLQLFGYSADTPEQ
jgi:hypothetical protein